MRTKTEVIAAVARLLPYVVFRWRTPFAGQLEEMLEKSTSQLTGWEQSRKLGRQFSAMRSSLNASPIIAENHGVTSKL